MRFYRFPDLRAAGVPFTRVHIQRLEDKGQFPKRVRLGANTVVWVVDEVDQWVGARVAERGADQDLGVVDPDVIAKRPDDLPLDSHLADPATTAGKAIEHQLDRVVATAKRTPSRAA
jgi:prophage regulatory protein